jgi:hypothetical protein
MSGRTAVVNSGEKMEADALMKRSNPSYNRHGAALALGIAATALAVQVANAHPYATSLTNNTGVVSFRLNEPAQSVEVLWNNGASKTNLGALPRGLTVTNVGATSPFEVKVQNTGTGTPALISENTNRFNQYEQPRGLAVNRRPASPFFGRIYVANARTNATATLRPMGDGVYVLNSDHTDALGQGDTALTGGLDFTTGGNVSPLHITVGQDDDYVYLTDWSDATGNLYRMDPNAATGELVFPKTVGQAADPLDPADNHGSLTGVAVSGSLADGTLKVWTVDEDYRVAPSSGYNPLWLYDIASGPLPFTAFPSWFADSPAANTGANQADVALATNGYLYQIHYRSAGAQNCLQVVDSTGTVLWKSRDASVNLGLPHDIFSNCVTVAVSRDMRYVAAHRSSGNILVTPLVDGLPDINARFEIANGGSSSYRQVGFDAANNILACDNSTERLRVFSLGLSTTAITKSNPAGNGGEGGDFELIIPSTTVSVTSDLPEIPENAGVATLTFTRANAASLAQPLNVELSTTGAATRDVDYVLKTNGVAITSTVLTIPAGNDSVFVTLEALNDTVAELTEAAQINIVATTNYVAGVAQATVLILDDEPPVADIVAVSSYTNMYERVADDYVRLRIVRRGDTNAPAFSVNVTYSGQAIAETDFAPVTAVQVEPGVVNQNFDIKPLNDALLEGTETFTASLASGTGYTIGTNSTSVTATIIDDDQPAETVIWSENFNEDRSADWTVKFSAANGIDDYTFIFNIDYASGGWFAPIPPAPHSTSDTMGMYLTVNKNDPTALGGAGINVYPNGKTFSGDYAIRFDMYLMVGAAASTTEYALMGLNHSGTKTNWFRNSEDGVVGGSFDGLFFGVEADAAALGDYVLYTSAAAGANNPAALTSVNASAFARFFKVPPYSYGGAPGVLASSTTPTWSDVEISQVGSLVTLKINQIVILQYTNTTPYTAGNIMLGYTDAYDSIMAGTSGVIIDNLRVISMTKPVLNITGVAKVGSNLELSFTFATDEPVSAFKLQSSADVQGGYADDATGTITKVSAGSYKATIPMAAGAKFFRLQAN